MGNCSRSHLFFPPLLAHPVKNTPLALSDYSHPPPFSLSLQITEEKEKR